MARFNRKNLNNISQRSLEDLLSVMQSKKANQQLKTIDSLDVDKKGNIVLTRERPKVQDIARRTPRLSTVKDSLRSGVVSRVNKTRFLQQKINNAIKDKVIQDANNYIKSNDQRMFEKLPPIKRLKVLLRLEKKPKSSIADKKELLGESQYYARKDVENQLNAKKTSMRTFRGKDKINAIINATRNSLTKKSINTRLRNKYL
jgi:hypothetical protein